jgi:OmpA-OmpF porin, OOP family
MNRKYVLSALAVVGMLVNADVQADDAQHSGFYLGTGLGVATNKVDDFESDGIAVKLLGGYTFNQYFAVEAEYIYAGTLEDTIEDVELSVKSDGVVVAALGKLPLADGFSLFAKLGYTFYDEKVKASRGDVSLTEKNSGEDLLYGVGADLWLGRKFQLRAEYEVVDVEDADFNVVSASAVFRF